MKLKLISGPQFVNRGNPLGLAVVDPETGELLRKVVAISLNYRVGEVPVLAVEVLDLDGAPLTLSVEADAVVLKVPPPPTPR
jgi:hypothetical protein